MTTFDHLASLLESNSSVTTDEIQVLPAKSSVVTDENTKINTSDNSAVATADFTDDAEIRQLQLANLPNFPLREFLSISFTHHITILAKTKTYEERMFYMKYATYKTADEMDPELLKALPPKEELQRVFVESSKKVDEKKKRKPEDRICQSS